MSAKPKALMKQHAKGKKKKEQTLNDADDYLAAAVDNEDAMGKHRGGDGPKALRFARRALELYEQGLAKYPRSFDLAYNKARLKLEIATHPILVQNLDVRVMDVLRQALSSHQYALTLAPDNADLLFNTAQVLTTIAEQTAKEDGLSNEDALTYLNQALQYQSQCFSLQEEKYAETRRLHEELSKQKGGELDEDEDGGAQLSAGTSSAYEEREEDEQWVSVIEPVTAGTLVDTILAQLATLTTVCSILSLSEVVPDASIPWIDEYSQKVLDGSLRAVLSYNQDEADVRERFHELTLAKAIFKAGLLELGYRSSSIPLDRYRDLIENAFIQDASLDQTLPSASATATTSEIEIAHARALISFNSAASDREDFQSQPIDSYFNNSQTSPNIRWNALSKAQKLLTTAAGHVQGDTATLATTHLLRGDVSLLLFALSQPPVRFEQAVTNQQQLLKNAEVFYRNATKLFVGVSDAQEEKDMSAIRRTAAEVLQQKMQGYYDVSINIQAFTNSVVGRSPAWVEDQLQDMFEEGLVEPATLGLRA